MPKMLAGLQTKYDVVPCLTLEEAQLVLLNEDIDLLMCGVYFDESRMFDLLRFAKAHPRTSAIPILCIKATPGMLGATFLQAADIATRALGAREFVDFAEWETHLDANAAFKRLLATIERLLS